MDKRAISVEMDVSPAVDVIAGMPASPVAVKNQGLRVPIRAKKTEGGNVATALSESFRETASQLERKFGSSDPFVLGLCYELDKAGAMPGFIQKLITKLRPGAVPKPAVPAPKIIVRSQSLKPPALSAPKPAPVEADPWSAMDPAIAKMDARRRRAL